MKKVTEGMQVFKVMVKVTKFDLAIKKDKVNPWSSFEQTMMGRSPRCYIQSFVEIGPLVLENKIFLKGFTI